MKKTALVLLLSSLLAAPLTSCDQKAPSPSSSEEAVTEQAAETVSETEFEAEESTETETEEVTEPQYFSELVYPDTMTEKEKSCTCYRDVTITHPDKASKIGVYYASYETSKTFRELLAMEDSIRELKIYDEELDTTYLAHIILPPDYDENKKYPIFFMNDAQYWFNRIPEIWALINDGETEPFITVTLGNDYDSDGYSDDARFVKFVLDQEKLLDFITNDLMKLVSLNYKTDSSRSVFFGHSLSGLFAHYALCNSDKYEDQPFANYVIGSPALWTYHFAKPGGFDISLIPDQHAFEREFDYFERNETMDKNVFICAGGDEHYEFPAPDLATIPEDSQALFDRLASHGVNAEIMIYEGKNHMNYVGDMFLEYLKKTFPAGDVSENQTQEE